MARYSSELKAALLKKLLPPINMSVAQLARQENISEATLYHWRNQAVVQRAKMTRFPGFLASNFDYPGVYVQSDKAGHLANRLVNVDAVFLDELGYQPFAESGGSLLFHLISKLYERTSLILTTNLAFSEWGKVFTD